MYIVHKTLRVYKHGISYPEKPGGGDVGYGYGRDGGYHVGSGAVTV